MVNLEGKRPHWKPRRRWEDCMKVTVHGRIWNGLKWLRVRRYVGLL
jgi:hypothetical protein